MVSKREWHDIEAAREIFGLADRATLRDIKAVFRQLVKKYHPDLAGEGAENRGRIQEIHEAYHVLLTYCENYEFPLRRADAAPEVEVEDWWMHRFGQDPLWGPGQKK
ncbi:MAG: J domain-containing protein [Deltaproteobacteria bacterium]|jgi:hypothetical protein|nr:J domain-containing protein [Deltaproteobacteria bacterium]